MEHLPKNNLPLEGEYPREQGNHPSIKRINHSKKPEREVDRGPLGVLPARQRKYEAFSVAMVNDLKRKGALEFAPVIEE